MTDERSWDRDDALDALMDAALERMMDDIFRPLAPGVEGLLDRVDGEWRLGGIRATEEGTGAVGAFLDELCTSRDRIAVPYVVNDRLEGMLERRGFRKVIRFDPTIGMFGEWWVRP